MPKKHRNESLVVGVASLVLVACGSSIPSLVEYTPEALPSLSAQEAERATAARDAFVALVADPELTFRVESELKAGEEDADGLPAFRLLGKYDATASDYAGQVQLAGHFFDTAVNVQQLSIGATTLVFSDPIGGWSEVAALEHAYRPNAIVGLGGDDLRFVGTTADGLLEFDVMPWIFGDPIGSVGRLGMVAEPVLPDTTPMSHRTRLVLDDAGVPQRIASQWTLQADGEDDLAEASLVQKFSDFGLYVSIREPRPDGPPMETSYDVIADLDVDGEVQTEPWFDVNPPAHADVAELEVVMARPDQPVMLGIEGAILFVAAHDRAGTLVLDQIISFEGDTARVPIGAKTVIVYYRPCDGWCGLLDPARTFCAGEAIFEAGKRYRVVVRPDLTDAECTVQADT